MKSLGPRTAVLRTTVVLASAIATQFAYAQATNPVTAPSDDAGAYSLKATAQQSTSGAASSTAAGGTYSMTGTSGIGAAQTSDAVIMTEPRPDAGAPIRLENGMFIFPSAFAGVGNNDNILGTNVDKKSSSFVNIVPSLLAEMKNHGDRYTALLNLNAMHYGSSSGDGYNSYEALLAGDNYFSARARLGWQVGQISNVDPRGSNDRPISAHPDRFHVPLLKGRFIYGANEAAGRFEVDAGLQHKRYENNLQFTEVGNVDTTNMAGRFFYRVGSRSLVLVEARESKFDYVSPLATYSNKERQYYVGYTWEATAKTTGIIKVGHMSKDYDLTGSRNFSGGSWEATMRWLPQTYSAVDLTSSKSTADPTGVGDYLLNTNSQIIWNHKWSKSLTSRVSAGILNTQFAGTTRKDDVSTMALTVDYAVLRYLKIGIDFAHTSNKSNDPLQDFRRNVIMFTVNGTL